jgi:hypothetical protein
MNLSFEVRPDLRELLGEIGKQEESALLGFSRAEKRNLARGHLPEPLGARAPFLSKAERHLLDVHREEYAELLTVMARRAHVAAGIASHPFTGLDDDCEAASQTELTRRAEVAGRLLPHLGSLYDLPTGRSAESLLAAAIRVSPTETRRLGLAAGSLDNGSASTAKRIVAGVLQPGATARASGFAWSVLGRAAALSGQMHDAFEFYQRAASTNPNGFVEAAYAMYLGLELADDGAWHECVGRVNDVEGDSLTITSLVAVQAIAISSGSWAPSATAISRVQTALGTVNNQTRRLLSAVVVDS